MNGYAALGIAGIIVLAITLAYIHYDSTRFRKSINEYRDTKE